MIHHHSQTLRQSIAPAVLKSLTYQLLNGLLYLHDGRLGDEQIVPESWVRDSLTPSDASEGHYGYQWWLTTDDGDR